MGWNWVNDLMVPQGRKKDFSWDARCPYGMCPGNKPINRKEVIEMGEEPLLKKPKLRFVQRISPLVYQYRCGYCGCLCNIGVEVPREKVWNDLNHNPAMWGGKPSYTFKNV